MPGPGPPCSSGLGLGPGPGSGPGLWREPPGGELGHCQWSCSKASYELGSQPLHPHLPASPVFGTRHRTVRARTHQHSRLEGSIPLLFNWANQGPPKRKGLGQGHSESQWQNGTLSSSSASPIFDEQRAGTAADRGSWMGSWRGGLMSLAGKAQCSMGGARAWGLPGENLDWSRAVGTNPFIPLPGPHTELCPPHLTLPGYSLPPPPSWPWLLPLSHPTLGPRCRGRLAQFPMGS